MTDAGPEVDLQTDRAHSARIYDYILGGKDNYAVDRAAAEATMAANPATAIGMRASRSFMHRVARHLAAEHGVRQFLDICTGIPTSPNLHEVVQAVAPETRVVYVDNDPIVLAHARALLRSAPEGRTAYINADMRDAASILDAPQLKDALDLEEPTALTLIGVLHCISDEEARTLRDQVMGRLSAGSFLAAAVLTGDFDPVGMAAAQEAYRRHGAVMNLRTRAEAEDYFTGLDMVEPGLVQIQKWHADDPDVGTIADTDVAAWGGIGRKP